MKHPHQKLPVHCHRRFLHKWCSNLSRKLQWPWAYHRTGTTGVQSVRKVGTNGGSRKRHDRKCIADCFRQTFFRAERGGRRRCVPVHTVATIDAIRTVAKIIPTIGRPPQGHQTAIRHKRSYCRWDLHSHETHPSNDAIPITGPTTQGPDGIVVLSATIQALWLQIVYFNVVKIV